MDNKQFWCEFFKIYKSQTALWRIKSPEYSNRVMKATAYEKLVEKLKEIYPDADREMVVKKINTYRTTFRKELKKVRDSEKISSCTDDVYVPSLWYYRILMFLEDQDQEENNQTNTTILDKSTEKLQNEPTRSKKRKLNEEDKLIRIACDNLIASRNNHSSDDTIAQSWAAQYKEMETTQKVLARKIIHDVLFHGCMGTLNMSSVIEIGEVLQNPATDKTNVNLPP